MFQMRVMARGNPNIGLASWRSELPSARANFSQNYMNASFFRLECALSALFEYDSQNNLDASNIDIITALLQVYESFIANGNFHCIGYYLSEKTDERFEDVLNKVCASILHPHIDESNTRVQVQRILAQHASNKIYRRGSKVYFGT